MLEYQTTEKLIGMRLSVMASEYRRQLEIPNISELSFEERLAMIVDAEWLSRENNRTEKLLTAAKLREHASLLDIDYDPRRKLDKASVARLSDLIWVKEARNMIITGETGTGKTYNACAFGDAACRMGIKTRYFRVSRLLADLAVGRGDGSYNRLLRTLKNTQLLILDDFGLSPLTADQGRDLLEVIEDRFGIGSTIISAQLPVTEWHALYTDSTIADAVLDRLVHNAYRLKPEGPSRRLQPQADYTESPAAGQG